MSKKQQRISALISMNNSLGDIATDADNQTAESIKKNMGILQDHVKFILLLDGVGSIKLNDRKVN